VAGRCCDRPIAKVIKIGGIDVGITGLERIMQNAYQSGIEDDENLKQELLAEVRAAGNYVTPSREEIYKETLLREYRKFQKAVQLSIENRRQQEAAEKEKRIISGKKDRGS